MDAELRELCERLRELLAKATPGLLQRCGHDRGGCSCGMVFAQDSDCFIADFSLSGDDEMRSHRPEADTRKANAALHVAAVNALPRLLDTIAAQAAELSETQRQLSAYRRTINKMDDRIEYWKTEFSRDEIHGFLQELTAELAQPNTAIADSGAGGGA